MSELTRKWLEGTEINYGVILLADTEDEYGHSLYFNSSEDAVDDQLYLQIIRTQTVKTVYFLKDHLGSIRATVDDIGQVIGYDDYDPWGLILAGRSLTTTLDGASKFKFTGKEWDDEQVDSQGNGLDWYYFGARYYDPEIGRLLSVDPVDHFSMSPYVYAVNNPLIYFDPTGADTAYIYHKEKGWIPYWIPDIIVEAER